MKWYTTLLIFLFGCTNENEIISLSDNFIENQSRHFIISNDIWNYNYGIRGHFYHREGYRVFVYAKSIKILCYSDSCLVDDASRYLKKGDYTVDNNWIVSTEVDSNGNIIDSTKSEVSNYFQQNPFEKFRSLKMKYDSLGIISTYTPEEKSFLLLYFDTDYYLLYSTNVNKTDTLPDYWQETKIKKYNPNWVLIKAKKNKLDFG